MKKALGMLMLLIVAALIIGSIVAAVGPLKAMLIFGSSILVTAMIAVGLLLISCDDDRGYNPLDVVTGRIAFGEEDHGQQAGIGISLDIRGETYRNAVALRSTGSVSDLIAKLRGAADSLESWARETIEREGVA